MATIRVIHALVLLAFATAPRAEAGPFPALLHLSTIDGANGFVAPGLQRLDRTGATLSGAGDVNGDGIDDIIIGNRRSDAFSEDATSESYVLFGAPGAGTSGAIDLTSLDGTNGFVIGALDDDDGCGQSVAGGGDFNGDGLADIIIGALGGDPNGLTDAGVSYLIFGAPGIGAGGAFDLSSLDGTNGFRINGVAAEDHTGSVVSFAGDVNADGFDDVMVSSPYASFFLVDPGKVYVVFGGPGVGAGGTLDLSSLDGTNGFLIDGLDDDDRCGAALAPAGDANHDGIDDLFIGAPQADPGGRIDAGEAYVIFGAPGLGAGGAFDLASLDGSVGFTIRGADPGDYCGISIASGDINADGVDDLFIGASRVDHPAGANAGACYVVFGGPGLGATGTLEPSTLDGTNGFVFTAAWPNELTGYAVTCAGDLNHDAVDDLVVGAPNAEPPLQTLGGEAYVVFGAPDIGASGTIERECLNGDNGFTIAGKSISDNVGESVASAGDFNHDGIADLVIGASASDHDGLDLAGEVFVVFGSEFQSPCAGDLDADADTDVLDFGAFTGAFGTSSGDCAFVPSADYNDDGAINVLDFGQWAADFGCGSAP